MKKKKSRKKSWLERKLESPRFRKGFEEEYQKLSIAEQILTLRLYAGLTQAQLAKKIGTTASVISRYENAQYNRYELQTLRKIAKACKGHLQVILTPEAQGKFAA